MYNRKKANNMNQFAPAVGFIFGGPIGAFFAIILNQSFMLFVGVGAGIGLVFGAIMQMISVNNR